MGEGEGTSNHLCFAAKRSGQEKKEVTSLPCLTFDELSQTKRKEEMAKKFLIVEKSLLLFVLPFVSHLANYLNVISLYTVVQRRRDLTWRGKKRNLDFFRVVIS